MIHQTGGFCEQVSEAEIALAKAEIGQEGIGCEPASAVTLAGLKKLVRQGKVQRGETVVLVLTGHTLKDSEYTIDFHRGKAIATAGDGGPGAGTGRETPGDALARSVFGRGAGGSRGGHRFMKHGTNTVRLRLPATSANLGPGFDAVALALELFLEIEATPASQFAIQASGRNRNLCGALNRNLLIQTYEAVLAAELRPSVPLALKMKNGIPIGMGCGSSAAVRLAGVALASAFGNLGWDAARIVDCATRLEGHPDNVAACWYGGMTISVGGPSLSVVTIAPPAGWRALLVLPENPVATSKARGVLPESYSRQDVVANVQSVALLAAAFALGRPDLMQAATRDRMHQPLSDGLMSAVAGAVAVGRASRRDVSNVERRRAVGFAAHRT